MSAAGVQVAREYRRDIDGLRALAVLSVLFYHAKVPLIGGGFVGVDVFFVISGYLITRHIAEEQDAGQFRLSSFYERRVRRILPALLAMLAATSVASMMLFLPADLSRYGKTLLGAGLSFSNMVFGFQGGYFQPNTELQPLLHTWSLGVEEQFYLAFPLLLMVVGRFVPKWRGLVVTLLFLLSFGLCLAATFAKPHWAFYLAPLRAWELMAGSLLALGSISVRLEGAARETAAGVALLALLGSFLLIRPDHLFPGLGAIGPVFATAALIHLAPGTLAGRLLSLPLLVGIGLISYSLYLWHWPVLTFARYVAVVPLVAVQTGLCLIVSLLLAWASWRFIERPTRERRRLPVRLLLMVTGGGTALLALAGVLLMWFDGLPGRLPAPVLAIARGLEDFQPSRDRCLFRDASAFDVRDGCQIGSPTAVPSVLLWGDSHADALIPAVDEVARRSGRAVINGTHVSCPPLLGIQVLENGQDLGCRRWNDAMVAAISRERIGTVILHARWPAYTHGHGFGFDADKTTSMSGNSNAPFAEGLQRTLEALEQRAVNVVLVASVPEQTREVPTSAARTLWFSGAAPAAIGAVEAGERRRDFVATLAKLSKRYPVRIVEPARILCDASCAVVKDGRALYYDSHHLSTFGARQLVPLLQPVLGFSPQRQASSKR